MKTLSTENLSHPQQSNGYFHRKKKHKNVRLTDCAALVGVTFDRQTDDRGLLRMYDRFAAVFLWRITVGSVDKKICRFQSQICHVHAYFGDHSVHIVVENRVYLAYLQQDSIKKKIIYIFNNNIVQKLSK